MAKADIVAAQLAAIQQGQNQVLSDAIGAAYDGGAQDQAAADGSSTSAADQAKIDALTAQVADLTAKDEADVKAGQDALAAMQSQMTDVQKQLADALAAKSADETVIQGLQAAASQIQGLLDQLKAIVIGGQ
jgi:hypothetical protein